MTFLCQVKELYHTVLILVSYYDTVNNYLPRKLHSPRGGFHGGPLSIWIELEYRDVGFHGE